VWVPSDVVDDHRLVIADHRLLLITVLKEFAFSLRGSPHIASQ